MKPSETPIVYTTSGWVKYGLCIQGQPDRVEAIRCHDLVASYLDANPLIAAQYRADQGGRINYLEVLALAEKDAAEKRALGLKEN